MSIEERIQNGQVEGNNFPYNALADRVRLRDLTISPEMMARSEIRLQDETERRDMEQFQFTLHSDEVGKIAEALALAQAQFPSIPREREVEVRMKSGGTYTFKYAELSTILEKTRGPLGANGLALTQAMNYTEQDTWLVTKLLHASGQWLAAYNRMPDAEDIQGLGSALTYLKRYAVQAILGVASDADDDGNHATGNTTRDIKNPAPPVPRATTGVVATKPPEVVPQGAAKPSGAVPTPTRMIVKKVFNTVAPPPKTYVMGSDNMDEPVEAAPTTLAQDEFPWSKEDETKAQAAFVESGKEPQFPDQRMEMARSNWKMSEKPGLMKFQHAYNLPYPKDETDEMIRKQIKEDGGTWCPEDKFWYTLSQYEGLEDCLVGSRS